MDYTSEAEKESQKANSYSNIALYYTSEAEKGARKANSYSNIALCFSIVAMLINVLAYLDEIESFVRYVLSHLH